LKIKYFYCWHLLGALEPKSANGMLRNYIKIACRNLLNSKIYSAINIVGLATGIAVALLIGLWVWDETSFNSYHSHYNRLAQVMVNTTNGEKIYTGPTTSIPMGTALQEKYAADFKYISLASGSAEHIIAVGDKKLSQSGRLVQEAFPVMFSLKMVRGHANALKDPSSVLLAQSVLRAPFLPGGDRQN
jgi:putative ABC transport system permease protein